ncbi:MAG: hypothetical protein K6C06_00440 [Lachnospiraceae bacterium]|nr:hypothetical protein [Lachnospiraceae bacterium]
MSKKAVISGRVSLSELIDRLEQYREKYGSCPVVGIAETLGEYNGMVNPYAVCVRKNADECERIFIRSVSGSGTPVPASDPEPKQKRVSRKRPVQMALFGV